MRILRNCMSNELFLNKNSSNHSSQKELNHQNKNYLKLGGVTHELQANIRTAFARKFKIMPYKKFLDGNDLFTSTRTQIFSFDIGF